MEFYYEFIYEYKKYQFSCRIVDIILYIIITIVIVLRKEFRRTACSGTIPWDPGSRDPGIVSWIF